MCSFSCLLTDTSQINARVCLSLLCVLTHAPLLLLRYPCLSVSNLSCGWVSLLFPVKGFWAQRANKWIIGILVSKSLGHLSLSLSPCCPPSSTGPLVSRRDFGLSRMALVLFFGGVILLLRQVPPKSLFSRSRICPPLPAIDTNLWCTPSLTSQPRKRGRLIFSGVEATLIGVILARTLASDPG